VFTLTEEIAAQPGEKDTKDVPTNKNDSSQLQIKNKRELFYKTVSAIGRALIGFIVFFIALHRLLKLLDTL